MSKLMVSPNPHIRGNISVQRIMMYVIIALLPAVIASGIIFGIRAVMLTAVCVSSCVLLEFFYRSFTARTNTTGDLSAVVTGILLGFNLPSTLPFYMAVIGSVISIIFVKQLFGGIGQNFANPAIVGRIVLMLSFPAEMMNYPAPKAMGGAVTMPTPLSALKAGIDVPNHLEMFLGMRGGVLGETCILALLIGFVFLLAVRVISPAAPIAFIGTVAVSYAIFGGDILTGVMSGGLMLGAVFMATDYTTAPVTTRGKIIFGIGCGVITAAVRQFSSMPEGVSFSILIMNILTPYIDRLEQRGAK